MFTHHYPETYKPKFHCRRQWNFGYVTVNGVNSNEKTEERIVARMCFVVYN